MTLAEPGSPNPVVYPEFRRAALQGPPDLLYDPQAHFGNRDVANVTPASFTGVHQWAVATAMPGLDTRRLRSAIDKQHAIMAFLDRPLAERTTFSLVREQVGGITLFTLRTLPTVCIAVVSVSVLVNWLVLTFQGIPAVGFGISALYLNPGESIALNYDRDVIRWWEPELAAAAVRLSSWR